MPSRPAVAAVLACLATAGCVMVPVTTATYDPACQVVTRHVELQAVQLGAIGGCSNQGCVALVIAAAGVTAVSAIVSGSIVVIGNLGYWAERRAGCVAPPPAAPPSVS